MPQKILPARVGVLRRFKRFLSDAFRVEGLNESTKKRINEKIKKYVLRLRFTLKIRYFVSSLFRLSLPTDKIFFEKIFAYMDIYP